MAEDTEESVLLQLDETFVYKVPPRTSSVGYRAELWGLDSPAATVITRLVAVGDTLLIRLVTPKKAGEENEKLFATATLMPKEVSELGLDHFVEPVRRSHRVL